MARAPNSFGLSLSKRSFSYIFNKGFVLLQMPHSLCLFLSQARLPGALSPAPLILTLFSTCFLIFVQFSFLCGGRRAIVLLLSPGCLPSLTHSVWLGHVRQQLSCHRHTKLGPVGLLSETVALHAAAALVVRCIRNSTSEEDAHRVTNSSSLQ